MLSSYPIQINSENIPFPDSWVENPKKITNTFDTESGGIKKVVVRSSRLSISASFTVSSFWLKKFQSYRNLGELTVRIYDATAGTYVSHTMFIDDESFSAELIPQTQYVGNTNGLYRLSFELGEF